MNKRDLAQFLLEHPTAVLLDVRGEKMYQAEHLPHAVNIPVDQLANRAHELPTDQPIVVYCTRGMKSQQGVAILHAAGFQQVYNLDGGLSSND